MKTIPSSHFCNVKYNIDNIAIVLKFNKIHLTSGLVIRLSQIGKNGSKTAMADDVRQIAKIINRI